MALGDGFGVTLPFVTFFCSGRTGALSARMPVPMNRKISSPALSGGPLVGERSSNSVVGPFLDFSIR